MKLKYKDSLQDFVVPLRSNISSTTPHLQYFSLPPNSNTKKYRKHGVHDIKLFPIDRQYLDAYRVTGDTYYMNLLRILNMFEQTIVKSCQNYLHDYEKDNKHPMTPDIDGILKMIDELNQIGIKIDMYRQEYRFTPAFAFIQAV